ncbi:hypothetical protein MBLNU459_g2869t1 [Dothideomycetes sp. NU459]
MDGLKYTLMHDEFGIYYQMTSLTASCPRGSRPYPISTRSTPVVVLFFPIPITYQILQFISVLQKLRSMKTATVFAFCAAFAAVQGLAIGRREDSEGLTTLTQHNSYKRSPEEAATLTQHNSYKRSFEDHATLTQHNSYKRDPEEAATLTQHNSYKRDPEEAATLTQHNSYKRDPEEAATLTQHNSYKRDPEEAATLTQHNSY